MFAGSGGCVESVRIEFAKRCYSTGQKNERTNAINERTFDGACQQQHHHHTARERNVETTRRLDTV